MSGLQVGTDQPIQTGGGFLDMDGATLTTQRAVTVDVALLHLRQLVALLGIGRGELRAEIEQLVLHAMHDG